jgi:VWFA-related protein
MKPSVLVSLLLVVSAAAAVAQQPLTEKIDVSLVNVDVSVTAHGTPAQGLTRDDFELLEDGVVQPITNFYAIENTPAASGAPAAAVPEERFRRKVLVIVDYVHSSKILRNKALLQLERFVDDQFTGGQYEWSIVAAGQDMKMLLPLTSDKERIHAAIAAMRAGSQWDPGPGARPIDLDIRMPFLGASGADADPVYTSFSLRALRNGSRAFAALEGKKIILLLSEGLGSVFEDNGARILASGDGGGFGPAAAARQLVTLRDELVHEANAANLNFYVLDLSGTTSIGTKGAMYWLASMTGGALLSDNSTTASLQKFEQLSSNFYSMAYRPPHADDGKYHRIVVRLKKPGAYHLQYREGYGAMPLEARLQQTLSSPASAMLASQSSSIAVSMTTGAPSSNRGRASVPLSVSVPLRSLQFIPAAHGSDAQVDFYVSIFENGKSVGGVQRYTTKAHANDDGNIADGQLTHNAMLHLRSGRRNTVVIAIHDQVSDAVAYSSREISF